MAPSRIDSPTCRFTASTSMALSAMTACSASSSLSEACSLSLRISSSIISFSRICRNRSINIVMSAISSIRKDERRISNASTKALRCQPNMESKTAKMQIKPSKARKALVNRMRPPFPCRVNQREKRRLVIANAEIPTTNAIRPSDSRCAILAGSPTWSETLFPNERKTRDAGTRTSIIKRISRCTFRHRSPLNPN